MNKSPDLESYDINNPPLAKLHIIAQLDRDLARYSSGRTRLPWKSFPIKDKETRADVARIEFNQDGGISFTFDIATTKERSWAINLQSLFDCVEAADALYRAELIKTAAEKNRPKASVKAAALREASKTLKQKVKKAKRKMTLKPGYSGLGRR